MTLQESLSRVDVTCTELGPECDGIRSFVPAFVDVMTAPSPKVLWNRTTLAQRGKLWSVMEHNQKVADLGFYKGTMKDATFIDEVLTLGHAVECTHEQLGFSQKRLYDQLLGPVATGDTSMPESAESGDAKSPLGEKHGDPSPSAAQLRWGSLRLLRMRRHALQVVRPFQWRQTRLPMRSNHSRNLMKFGLMVSS